jgi:hypothetical protein
MESPDGSEGDGLARCFERWGRSPTKERAPVVTWDGQGTEMWTGLSEIDGKPACDMQGMSNDVNLFVQGAISRL